MAITRNLFFALSLIMFPVIIESCCNSGWKCCDIPDPKTYSVNALSMKTTTFNGTTYVDAPAQIKPRDISFNFKLDVTYLSHHLFRPTMAAYACDPVPDSSKEKVTAFSITSDQPLELSENVIFAAGTELKKLFSLAESIEGNPFYYDQFNMVPGFGVLKEQDHEFTFRFTLDDGRIFEARSGVHTLLP